MDLIDSRFIFHELFICSFLRLFQNILVWSKALGNFHQK